ncbi:hypothetical protein FHW58_004702 [Duganella sp. 1224]|uniref:hypothetical protein n=1 Tax=Duganella sp. 1224 TaxID=2587052 RepID=UPI0015CDCCA3|nr:hypothetical protein [Duganella sp. 1224]NYE63472.1 hypothetical protein [Duganella sp. 1224]
MKKYLTAGLLAACLTAPAFAANNKFVAQSPEEPLHRRAIVLCMAVMIGLQYLRHLPNLPTRRHAHSGK